MTDVVTYTRPRYRVKAGRSDGIVTKVDGGVTPGPWQLPVSDGWLSVEAGSYMNWWQMGYDVEGLGNTSAIVEACVSAYSQTVAMCPGDHWRLKSNGGRERVTTSALARWLKKPNAYQTISDFLLNSVSSMYSDGNAYGVALRNNRFEIEEIHPMVSPQCNAIVAETGDIFYQLGGNPVIDRVFDYPMLVPSRDVMHLKLKTSRHNMLKGESPIVSAARDIAAGNAMAAQQLSFYLNQARPSVVLSTDMTLDAKQVDELRARWDAQSKGLGRGGTPILTAGLKPVPLSDITAQDSQLAQIMKMSEQRIALAFRIPLQILGIGGGATAPGSTSEMLMGYWLASSLGFCLNHIEESIGKLFGLAGYPDEYLEFNTDALLRSAFKDRIEGLARAVQGGIFAPDEAREKEGYPKVPGGFGEEPRVQAQVVPLSAAQAIPAAPTSPSSTSVAPADDAEPEELTDDQRSLFRRRFNSSHERQQQRVD
jgi:HK97 family phage portal protein